jgi:hypothetical protein
MNSPHVARLGVGERAIDQLVGWLDAALVRSSEASAFVSG